MDLAMQIRKQTQSNKHGDLRVSVISVLRKQRQEEWKLMVKLVYILRCYKNWEVCFLGDLILSEAEATQCTA